MENKKIIVVSGTPATGKTTIAKKLSEYLKYRYVDVNKVIKDNNLCEDYDKARHCNVVDVNRLNVILIKLIDDSEESLVIDSHMAHFLPKDKVDLVIITKCGLKELERRLHEREYPEAKVRENLDSEIFDICLVEAKEKGHDIIEINTDKEINIKIIKNKIDLI
ncbi:adenylate kinase family protein [Thermoproteota archaeon]